MQQLSGAPLAGVRGADVAAHVAQVVEERNVVHNHPGHVGVPRNERLGSLSRRPLQLIAFRAFMSMGLGMQ